jgi:hypothetical protein
MGGRPGQNTITSSGNYYLYINGGYVYVNAAGDGIDVNGSITMTAGTVLVNGPTENNNAAFDYDGACIVNGGFLVAVGSSGMAQAPGTSSGQYSLKLNFTSTQSANTVVHIQSSNGADILTFVPVKTYTSVVICSPGLTNGSSYTVYTGGSSTGTLKDGLYTGGTYTAGTQYTTFTVSGKVTSIGSSGNAGPGRR